MGENKAAGAGVWWEVVTGTTDNEQMGLLGGRAAQDGRTITFIWHAFLDFPVLQLQRIVLFFNCDLHEAAGATAGLLIIDWSFIRYD